MTEEKSYLEKQIRIKARKDAEDSVNEFLKFCDKSPVTSQVFFYTKHGYSYSLNNFLSHIRFGKNYAYYDIVDKLTPYFIEEETDNLFKSYVKVHEND